MAERAPYEPIDALYDILDEIRPGSYSAQELAETAMLRAGISPPYTVDSNFLALAEKEIDESIRQGES